MAHDKMMKMLMSKKKEGKKLSDSDKKAKLQALGGMRDMASSMMGDKLKNLKKVVVAADSTQGFQFGPAKKKPLLKSSSPDDEKDKDQGDSMYSQGGNVDELPDHENSLNDADEENRDPRAYYKGGKVGQLPSEFDRDEDHVVSEHDRDNSPRHFNDGGDVEDSMPESPEMESQEGGDESLDQIVEECPEDADQIDELIRKLEEKKQRISQ